MEQTKKKKPSPIVWALGQAGAHRGQLGLSMALAILGVAFSVVPYFAVVDIVRALMAAEKYLRFYLLRAGLIALLWLGRVLCHAFSTSNSHKTELPSTFQWPEALLWLPKLCCSSLCSDQVFIRSAEYT